MKLTFFEAKNLFSFESVNIGLDNKGVVLVSGWNEDDNTANGSGKSSLTSKGISWVLYGRTMNGLKGDDVKRNGSEGESWGLVEFTDRFQNKYRIKRYRSPTKLVLEKKEANWKDISNRVQSETQEEINRLLGKDFQVFSNTDFFGQGLSNSFVQLSSIQQNSLFEFVISLDQVNKLVAGAKDRKANVLNKLYEIEHKANKISGSIKEIDEQIITLNSKSERISNAKKELLEDLDGVIFEDFLSNLDKSIQETRKDSEEIFSTFNKFSTELNNLNRQREGLLAQRREIKQNLCPTCNQPIQADLFQRLVEAQKKILEDLKSIEPRLEEINKITPEWNKKYYETNNLLKQLEEKFRKASIVQEQDSFLNIKELEDKKINYKQEINELERLCASYRDEASLITFWEKAFNVDFRNFLIEKSCPFLQYRANKHLLGLGQPQLKILFSTDKELKSGDKKIVFNVAVKNENGGDGFDCLSGGEQQFVSFAANLAFADLVAHVNNSDSNIMILDEPFVCLDDSNAEKLVNYIVNSLSKVKETILLVSNENSIKDLVPQRINIIKENGISRIG